MIRTLIAAAVLSTGLALSAHAAPGAAPSRPAPQARPATPPRAAQAAGATASSKGLKSWFKTLKERFLRRCQDPWAPDPAPSPAP